MSIRGISERLVRQRLNQEDINETLVVDGKWYWKFGGVCYTQPTDKSEPKKEISEEEYRDICYKSKNPGTNSKLKRDAYGDFIKGKMGSEEDIVKNLSPKNREAYEYVDSSMQMLPKGAGKSKAKYDNIRFAYSEFMNTGSLKHLDYVTKEINKLTGRNVKVELPENSNDKNPTTNDTSMDELRNKVDRLKFDDITEEGTDEEIGDYTLSVWKSHSRDLGDHVQIQVEDKEGKVLAYVGDIQSQSELTYSRHRLLRDTEFNHKLNSMTKEEITSSEGLHKRLSIVGEKNSAEVKLDKNNNPYITYSNTSGKFRAAVKDMTKELESLGFTKSVKLNKTSSANTDKTTYTHPGTDLQVIVKEYASRNSSKTSGYIQVIKNPIQ